MAPKPIKGMSALILVALDNMIRVDNPIKIFWRHVTSIIKHTMRIIIPRKNITSGSSILEEDGDPDFSSQVISPTLRHSSGSGPSTHPPVWGIHWLEHTSFATVVSFCYLLGDILVCLYYKITRRGSNLGPSHVSPLEKVLLFAW